MGAYLSADLKVIIWEIPFQSIQRLGASLAHSRRKEKNFWAQGLRKACIVFFASSQPAHQQASTHTIQPASHLACLVFPHFCSPDFAQAPRKVWRKVCKLFNTTPVFDSKGTSASNHSCIKTAKASLLVQQHRSPSLSINNVLIYHRTSCTPQATRCRATVAHSRRKGKQFLAQGFWQMAFSHTSDIDQHSCIERRL